MRRFGQLVLTYPGMLLAAAGAGLLVAVAVLSVRAARRRLRYESWHLLHLYAYLGIGLALPHQLWNGTEFVTGAAARASAGEGALDTRSSPRACGLPSRPRRACRRRGWRRAR